ncbi:hypothetical protein IF1G_07072 [Cordyceps javanica]|uniref:Uncharacterized protein n=1 Tax=Cordyceps javanica TaxID=43265 RepID=A0A545UXK4_9HYPO|nr:hypothetical protein IF1G_07072 [Cordyceps javanica]
MAQKELKRLGNYRHNIAISSSPAIRHSARTPWGGAKGGEGAASPSVRLRYTGAGYLVASVQSVTKYGVLHSYEGEQRRPAPIMLIRMRPILLNSTQSGNSHLYRAASVYLVASHARRSLYEVVFFIFGKSSEFRPLGHPENQEPFSFFA